MGVLNREKNYRLRDREPGKKKKERKIVHEPKPPRPLSWLSCGILLLFGTALFCYAAVTLIWHFGGVETEAVVNTTLDESGGVAPVEITAITSTVQYTYRDADGTLHAGSGSLLGNTGTLGNSIAIRYLRSDPDKSQLAFRSNNLMVPLGCIFLGVFLIWTAISRLREIYGKKEPPETTEAV